VRAYLSSFRLGDHPERLVELIPSPKRVAVIANSIDNEPADLREEKVAQEIAWLTDLGLYAEELDLRDWFPELLPASAGSAGPSSGGSADAKARGSAGASSRGSSGPAARGSAGASALRDRLATYQGVWVRGGNVFVLRSAMARSGADVVLSELVASDALVYAGYSAGPCVLAPSLRGLELCDDPGAVAATGGEVIWEGLGLLDHAFVPHLNSPGHPETELLARTAEHYRLTGVPHITLRDGQALLINGPTQLLL
jgi:dipeptidase E